MLFRPPFKDSLSSCWGCCQWATLNHQAACNDPSRWRYKDWPLDVLGQPWRAIFIPDAPWDQLKSSSQWSSLIFPSALSRFFPPDSTVLIPRAALINIPALNSNWVCIPENQPVSENIPVFREYFYLKITGYTCTYNILKPLNKIQNGGNKDFLCEYQTHNLMLSGQNEIKLYINNKRKLLCWNTWKCHFIQKAEC